MSIITINSGNLKDLSINGINPKTIELLEGIRRTGGIFNNKSDLEKIGIAKDEIDKIIPNISFSIPEPVKTIKTATIETDLNGLSGYILLISYQNKTNYERIESAYSISATNKTEIKYDNEIASENFIIAVKSPNGELAKIDTVDGKALFISNSRYPSVIRASQACEGFDFYGHNPTLQALKACPNTA